MGAPVVWFEIAGRDLDALGRFYGDLLGWKLDADNLVRYGSVETGGEGGIKGGIWAPGEPGGEDVSFYASVEDLDATLGQAEQLGGRVLQPPRTIADGMRIAMMLDPEGHRIGLLQPPQEVTPATS